MAENMGQYDGSNQLQLPVFSGFNEVFKTGNVDFRLYFLEFPEVPDSTTYEANESTNPGYQRNGNGGKISNDTARAMRVCIYYRL